MILILNKKKYGYKLGRKSNFYQRYLIAKHFLAIQKCKPNEIRRDLVEIVASTFDRGKTSRQIIIDWENSWVNERKIFKQEEDENDPT